MIEAVEPQQRTAAPVAINAVKLETIGHTLLRYGLVLFLIGGGLAKFTNAEAEFIRPLMANSPFFAWLYSVTSVQGASNLIGVVELLLGVLLAAHRWLPRVAAVAGIGAALEFVFTVSFLFTTPSLSTELSGFLSKDVLLFGVALWAAGESLRASRRDVADR